MLRTLMTMVGYTRPRLLCALNLQPRFFAADEAKKGERSVPITQIHEKTRKVATQLLVRKKKRKRSPLRVALQMLNQKAKRLKAATKVLKGRNQKKPKIKKEREKAEKRLPEQLLHQKRKRYQWPRKRKSSPRPSLNLILK